MGKTTIIVIDRTANETHIVDDAGRAAMFKKAFQMNVNELLWSGANVAITVTPTDLKEFAITVINEVMEAKKAKENESETYLRPDETAKRLNVSVNTLWRWNKSKYLCPVKVGHKSFYRLSDVNKLMEG